MKTEFVVNWNRGVRRYAHYYEHLTEAQDKARQMVKKGAKWVSIRQQIDNSTKDFLKIKIVSFNIPF